jgi:hypothetical protein
VASIVGGMSRGKSMTHGKQSSIEHHYIETDEIDGFNLVAWEDLLSMVYFDHMIVKGFHAIFMVPTGSG